MNETSAITYKLEGTSSLIHKSRKRKKLQWSLYIMIFPSLLLTLIYAYGPLAGLAIAFQKYDLSKGLFGSEWIGLDNFKFLLMYPGFGNIIYNTVFISVLKLIFQTIVPIIVALLLNEVYNEKFKRSIQTLIYLPDFISWVIISGIMIDLLSPSTGIVNHIMKSFGMEPVMFLAEKDMFPYIIVFSDTWKAFGFGTIMYMAALTQIDPNLYEAAKVDGAGRLKRAIYITIPGILPVIVLVFVLKLGGIVQNAGFDQIVNLYSPLVYETGDILDTFVYRLAFQSSIPQYDIATAVGIIKSATSFILVSTSYYIAYKVADYKIF